MYMYYISVSLSLYISSLQSLLKATGKLPHMLLYITIIICNYILEKLGFSQPEVLHSISVLVSAYCSYFGHLFTHKVVRRERERGREMKNGMKRVNIRINFIYFLLFLFRLSHSFSLHSKPTNQVHVHIVFIAYIPVYVHVCTCVLPLYRSRYFLSHFCSSPSIYVQCTHLFLSSELFLVTKFIATSDILFKNYMYAVYTCTQ